MGNRRYNMAPRRRSGGVAEDSGTVKGELDSPLLATAGLYSRGMVSSTTRKSTIQFNPARQLEAPFVDAPCAAAPSAHPPPFGKSIKSNRSAMDICYGNVIFSIGTGIGWNNRLARGADLL